MGRPKRERYSREREIQRLLDAAEDEFGDLLGPAMANRVLWAKYRKRMRARLIKFGQGERNKLATQYDNVCKAWNHPGRF